MPVTKYHSIEDVPRPAARPTPAENLRLACELSDLCFALAKANGSTPVRARGEALPSGRVWRWEGPTISRGGDR
jgi:hypothetical protein